MRVASSFALFFLVFPTLGLTASVRLKLPEGFKIHPDAPSWIEIRVRRMEGMPQGLREILPSKVVHEKLIRAEGASQVSEVPISDRYQGRTVEMEGKVYFCDERNQRVCLMRNLSEYWRVQSGSVKEVQFSAD